MKAKDGIVLCGKKETADQWKEDGSELHADKREDEIIIANLYFNQDLMWIMFKTQQQAETHLWWMKSQLNNLNLEKKRHST